MVDSLAATIFGGRCGGGGKSFPKGIAGGGELFSGGTVGGILLLLAALAAPIFINTVGGGALTFA